MEIILAPTDVAIIWLEMQCEENNEVGIGPNDKTEELTNERKSTC